MTFPVESQIRRKSKAPLIIGLVAVVMVIVIIGAGVLISAVVWAVHRNGQQQAMANVYNQRKAAIDAFGARARQRVPMRQNCDQSMTDLRVIDLAGCPGDFQDKFLANVKAYGQLMVDIKNDTGLLLAMKVLSQVRTLNAAPMTKDVKDLDEAALAFQMSDLDLAECARSYGLKITANK
jgi:type II secretory pathway pseudopilin PulG